VYYENLKLDENNNPISVDVVCEKCGCIKTYYNIEEIFYWNPGNLKYRMLATKTNDILKCPCGNIHHGETSRFTEGYILCDKRWFETIEKSRNQAKSNLNSSSSQSQVQCPYCHSTNVKKISTTTKVGSIGLFGIFGIGKATKQWHCNNCKSDF
jgi:hypothetical protein